MKKNTSLHCSRFFALILIGPALWLALLIWPAVAHSQQETRWPTHYVIVVRNTSLNVPETKVELISENEFESAIKSIPRGLAAASGQISLWRKPEPGDLISVVFAAAGKYPSLSGQRGCKSHHYPNPLVPAQSKHLKLGTYFDVRARIVVEEHDSLSHIAGSSSRLHEKLLKSLVVKDCDLIANAYSEGLTLAKGLAAVENNDAIGEEKYKQFFLLVFDFASPAYGSTEFNATFDVSHEDLAPGTPAYLIASIGSLKFTDREWSLDLINYLDYPAKEPGGTTYPGERDMEKFYPRLRFYRAVAHEASSDPFYDLADLQREATILEEKFKSGELQVAQLEKQNAQLNKRIGESINNGPENGVPPLEWQFVAWIAAAAFALLMVLVTWRWWVIKGRFRRMTEEHQKELQQMREEQSGVAETQKRHLLELQQDLEEEFREKQAALEVEKEKQKSLSRNAVCIPDAPNTEQANEFA